MGPQVINKNQPIRLADFGARTQKYGGVPARTAYSEDPDVARDNSARALLNMELLVLLPPYCIT